MRLIKFTLILCVAVLVISSPLVSAQDIEKLSGMRFVQLVRGGLMYDNWPADLGVSVEGTHPAYPDIGQHKGPDTWRCKECHGWDYKGKAGAYSKGRHFTGIRGIRNYANHDPKSVVKILMNDTHNLKDKLTDNDFDALAMFVSYGQIDVDIYIDRKTKKSIGDASNGGRIYLSTCIKCHGADGKEMNMGDDSSPVFVGTAANDNPWETLHIIRWGHANTPMISLVFLGLKEQLDVLAFCQALPR
jgi:thiosulfate dehydrogenase